MKVKHAQIPLDIIMLFILCTAASKNMTIENKTTVENSGGKKKHTNILSKQTISMILNQNIKGTDDDKKRLYIKRKNNSLEDNIQYKFKKIKKIEEIEEIYEFGEDGYDKIKHTYIWENLKKYEDYDKDFFILKEIIVEEYYTEYCFKHFESFLYTYTNKHTLEMIKVNKYDERGLKTYKFLYAENIQLIGWKEYIYTQDVILKEKNEYDYKNLLLNTIVYNENKQKLEEKTYQNNGELLRWTFFDRNLNIIKEKKFNEKGIFINEVQYDRFHNGNIKNVKKFNNKNKLMTKKTYYTEGVLFKKKYYNDKEMLMTKLIYDDKGDVSFKNIYNEKEILMTEIAYYPGAIEILCKKTFYENGNVKEKIYYTGSKKKYSNKNINKDAFFMLYNHPRPGQKLFWKNKYYEAGQLKSQLKFCCSQKMKWLSIYNKDEILLSKTTYLGYRIINSRNLIELKWYRKNKEEYHFNGKLRYEKIYNKSGALLCKKKFNLKGKIENKKFYYPNKQV